MMLAMMRAVASVPPPAPHGTTSVIGRFGYCAVAGATSAAATTEAAASRNNERRSIRSSFGGWPRGVLWSVRAAVLGDSLLEREDVLQHRLQVDVAHLRVRRHRHLAPDTD